MQRADHPDDVDAVVIRRSRLPGVGRLCGYRETTGAPLERTELPWPGVVLIVNLADDLQIDGVAHRSFIAGLSDRPTLTRHPGTQAGVQVDLDPLAAHALLGGLPMRELAREVVPLEALLGTDPAERLAALPTWAQRLQALEDLLLALTEPVVAPDVDWAWRRLRDSHGTVGVEQLAAELGCSRRHLANRFALQIGLPPKRVARIFRFQRALALRDTGMSIAEVALEAGFADHAHLDRDFRDLAGAPPSQVVLERYDEAQFPFVQDAAVAPA